MKDLIIIITLVIVVFILYKLINNDENDKTINNSKCNIENFDIDNMYIINRGKEYEKYINQLIDKNKKIFSDEELKILKNKFQFYNIKDRENIKNISNYIYKDYNKELLNSTMKINDPDEDVEIYDLKLLEDNNYLNTIAKMNDEINNIKLLEDKNYLNTITKMNDEINNLKLLEDENYLNNIPKMNDEINNLKLLEDENYLNTIAKMNSKINKNEINCNNIEILKDKDYLKNYYIDIFGNRINAELKDYFSDYYAEINNNLGKDKCIKINSKNIGNYMFIPNQFKTQKYLTNAYNIDYNRIVNPWTIY